MESRVGQRLGNYRLISLLGRGGFAEVYLGEHVYLKTPAALKILHVSLTNENQLAFLDEARTIAHLRHPHIVQVHDFGIHKGVPFLVMDYAPFGSLRAQHPRGSILSSETIITYINQVASALQYAHEHRLIHRDIKPENMLLGQNHEVLLGDFGLAVVASSSQQQSVLGAAGTIIYMAPEQLHGNPCIASDQYALGVVVYEWLCGTPPFTGSAYPQIALQHLNVAPPSLREKVPTISLHLEQVVLKAIAKVPEQRFNNVLSFASALQEALEPMRMDKPHQQTPLRLAPPSPHEQRQQASLFVGREEEQAVLHQLLLDAEATIMNTHVFPTSTQTVAFSLDVPPRTTCAMLLGDAGIGKTQLAKEVSRTAHLRGWNVIWNRAYAQETTVSYQPWIAILRQIIPSILESNQQRDSLFKMYHYLSILLPELADLLPQQSETAMPSTRQDQVYLWEAIWTVLTMSSEEVPLLIVLDDLHWADHSSQELLAYLVRRLAGYPIFFIGTCRKADVAPDHLFHDILVSLQREQVLTILKPSPLTDIQIETLLAQYGLSETIVQHIQRLVVGNPFFAEELARVTKEEETTVREGMGSSAHMRAMLPQSITGVLDAHLKRLSPACRQLLMHASILGGSFTFSTITTMESIEEISPQEETFVTLLEEALQAEILTEEGIGIHITYHFRHPLFINHLYQGISAARRARLHLRVAVILSQLYAHREEEGAAIITYHLIQGGDESSHLARYAELAGNRAYALSAYPDAEHYYRLALEHLGSDVDEYQRRTYLLECLGECTRVLGKDQEARLFYEQALAIHSQQIPLYNATPYEVQIQALLWCEIGLTWFNASDIFHALESFERSEQLLQEADIIMDSVWAKLRYEQSYCYWWEGDYEKARFYAQEALERLELAMQQPTYLKELPFHSPLIQRSLAGSPIDLGRIHMLLGIIVHSVGQYHDSLAYHNSALTLFEQYGCQREIAIACCNLGDLYLRRAEYSRAQTVLRRALGLAEHMGDIANVSFIYGNLGLIALHMGNLTDAETSIKRTVALLHSIEDTASVSLWSAHLATILIEQGKLSEAKVVLQDSLAIARAKHLAPRLGSALVAVGNIRISQAKVVTISDKSNPFLQKERVRFLYRGTRTIEKALALEEIEIETRIEGQLALAQIAFLLGKVASAEQQVRHIIEMVSPDSAWLFIRTQRLWGSILAAQGQYEQAKQHFEQALEGALTYEMRLEYARVLQCYGMTLLQQKTLEEDIHQQGLSYLHRARLLFIECQAMLDLQVIEHELLAYDGSIIQEV